MGENTKIEWAHHTFNPWYGCQKVGPGCDHCYAEGWAKRSGLVQWGPGTERRRSSPANWRKPLAWNAEAERLGIRYRVFCASLADVFDNAVPTAWRMDLFSLIAKTPHLDWLIVTKRIGNVMSMCSGDGLMFDMIGDRVWLGISVVNQEEADRDIPKLFQVPARARWLSMEPLLGPVDLEKWLDPWTCSDCGHHGAYADTGPDMCADCGLAVEYAPEIGSGRCPKCGKDNGTSDDVGGTCPCCGSIRGWSRDYGFMFDAEKPAMLDWVVMGGESGPKARPMHPQWARDLRDQCAAAGVPFLFKQWGEWVPRSACYHTFEDGKSCADYDPGAVKWPCIRLTESGHDGRRLENVDGGCDAYMQRVGKKFAGRLLDGMQHDGYPELKP